MKTLLLGTTCALASFLGFIPFAKAAESACIPPDAAMLHAQAAAQNAGGVAMRLGGDQAEDFIDYINDNTGQHADYWGDGIIVGRFPALGYDTVAIIDGDCVNETKLITLNPMTTNLAFQAAQFGTD
jgi:hypothetical protein